MSLEDEKKYKCSIFILKRPPDSLMLSYFYLSLDIRVDTTAQCREFISCSPFNSNWQTRDQCCPLVLHHKSALPLNIQHIYAILESAQ